ncbi:MAG: HAMP domain-containing protein [Deltaproteobacteria bacterium]|nr:HAMP domain-containing protein [Deltaproteobacteria bacterium]
MSLRLKLVIIIFCVALVPLTIFALTSLGIHQKAFENKIGELHRLSAKSGAAAVQSRFDNAGRAITQAARSIEWPALSPSELEGALWLLYQQLDDIAVVTMLDGKGEGIGKGAYLDSSGSTKELEKHPVVTMPQLEEFSKHIPFNKAIHSGYAMGDAFWAPGMEAPMIPLAVSVKGETSEAKWVVVAAVSLRTICEKILEMSSMETHVHLVDVQDRSICASRGSKALGSTDPALHDRLSGEDLGDLRYRNAEGEEMLATIAPLPEGFTIVVQQPESVAFSSSRSILLQTIFWIIMSAIAAAVTGLFLARSISEPVRRLVQGALELAKGNFDFRLKAKDRGDEISRLSSTFNYMGEEIERRDEEIREWNRELQSRVDEQARKLKEVQDQLLQSQKIAAVTSLGAGVAHEINNPLTGVIGLTQILIAKTAVNEGLRDHKELLESIEKEAQRIKDIVGTLLTFTEGYAGENFTSLNLNQVIDESVHIIEEEYGERDIVFEKKTKLDIPPILGNASQLRQVFLELFRNSVHAMPMGGRIILSSSFVVEQVLQVEVRDTGKGIRKDDLTQIFEPFYTNKEKWRGEGLGLTMVFRIIEEHHGSIKASSVEGEGTTMTITLPAQKGGAHLA